MHFAISAPNRIWRQLADWAIAVCILLSVCVFVARGVNAWKAAAIAPGMAVTSGYEEESIFAVWRAVHGQTVYVDPSRLPYASAYFNWLFYASYAAPTRVAVMLSGDAVIPRVGRLLTALGALFGTGILFWFTRKVLPDRTLLAAGLAFLVYFGPLVGWWAHTFRADVWALVLETAALVVLLSTYRKHSMAAALFSCLLFYSAWSFKQSYFLGLGTALLFLAVRRQWRPVVVLTLGSSVLWVTTFLAMGPAYRAAFRAISTNNIFYLALGLSNLRDMLLKCAPFWLLAAALLIKRSPSSATPASSLASDTRLLGLLGLLFATPLAFAASCKLGAASNYYFSTLMLLAFFTAGLAAAYETPKPALIAFTAAVGLQLLVALGRVGQISLIPQASELATTWAVWHKEPEPRFSAINALNQPWLNPGSPPLVLAFNYPRDRQAGVRLEAGGVGGLITAGYFRTLLLPVQTTDEYDGGSLRQYARSVTVNGLTVFRRLDIPEK